MSKDDLPPPTSRVRVESDALPHPSGRRAIARHAAGDALTDIRGPLLPHYESDAELLAAFGGKVGIQKLADVFVDRMRTDPRIGHYLEKTKLPQLKESLALHLSELLAGPCVYEGDRMNAAHADWGITRADSLAQVDILQSSMDSLGIPFRAQNQVARAARADVGTSSSAEPRHPVTRSGRFALRSRCKSWTVSCDLCDPPKM